jgi:hypothetical protein
MVKGAWLIDPQLKIPESFLVDIPPQVEQRPHAWLESQRGVSAYIKTVGDQSGRMRLYGISTHGSVTMNIASNFG